jgi:hypothetical protein
MLNFSNFLFLIQGCKIDDWGYWQIGHELRHSKISGQDLGADQHKII